MQIADAQRDVRTTFIGGFAGSVSAAFFWGASAATLTWGSFRAGVAVLVFGGCFIFPLTQLILRLMGGPHSLPKGHPMNGLAMQAAFSLPLAIPVALAAALHCHGWFYPAMMIIVGCHYLPFIFLYGMWEFGALAALLIGPGLLIGLYLPADISLGGWLTAAILLVFAFVGRRTALAKRG
jgi:hypothetical protein